MQGCAIFAVNGTSTADEASIKPRRRGCDPVTSLGVSRLPHAVQLLLVAGKCLRIYRRPIISIAVNRARQALVGVLAPFRGKDQQPVSTRRRYLGYRLRRVFPGARPD